MFGKNPYCFAYLLGSVDLYWKIENTIGFS